MKEAREALADKALEVLEGYLSFIKDAHAAQEFEVANDAYQFLIRHMPKITVGELDGGMVEPNIDKDVKGSRPEKDNKPVGPTIQIGIALGQKQLKEAAVEVIDVTNDKT